MVNTKLFHISCFIFFVLAVSSCNRAEQQSTLTIATAANMQFAMEELVKTFSDQNGIPCDIVISSSGKHTAQIIEGAPYDIFVSADTLYPKMLESSNKSLFPTQIYAYGHLVLWSGKFMENISLESLLDPEVDHIAIANPKTAPYGKSANDALRASKLLGRIKSKLVFGENVAQTNQFILSGAADIGITAKSVVLALPVQNTGSWMEIDPLLYDLIPQGIVLLNTRPMFFNQAKMFQEFIFSDNGKEILNNFGYSVPDL